MISNENIQRFLTIFSEEDVDDLIDEMTHVTKKKLKHNLNEEEVKGLVQELACISKLKTLMIDWKELNNE